MRQHQPRTEHAAQVFNRITVFLEIDGRPQGLITIELCTRSINNVEFNSSHPQIVYAVCRHSMASDAAQDMSRLTVEVHEALDEDSDDSFVGSLVFHE